MRSIDNRFYRSKAWIRCKEDYLSSVGRFCERCKAKGIYEPAVIVHHKIYLSEENYKNPAVSLNFDNLEALCASCHNQEHFGNKDERRFSIDADGNLIF